MRSSSRRIVVVLPAPFGPRKPKTSPCSTARSTSMIPRWAPYDLVSCSVSMMAVIDCSFSAEPVVEGGGVEGRPRPRGKAQDSLERLGEGGDRLLHLLERDGVG